MHAGNSGAFFYEQLFDRTSLGEFLNLSKDCPLEMTVSSNQIGLRQSENLFA